MPHSFWFNAIFVPPDIAPQAHNISLEAKQNTKKKLHAANLANDRDWHVTFAMGAVFNVAIWMPMGYLASDILEDASIVSGKN